jgi:GT2 family glycosyltransferase/glycosyltransferase involved in cell wall biosynthesis
MNIILVSHCNFLGQSAYHVHSIAKELSARGCACILCVPDGAILSAQHVAPAVPIINYDVALEQGLVFPNGNGPSLIHCWTPREHVRQFTETLAARYGCPYVVHLEDNEREILNRELEGMRYEELEKLHPDVQDIVIPPYRIHPARHWRFMCNAAGITVLIDRLIEHIPDGVPGLVFWPGYDELFSSLPLSDHSELRKKYGVADDAFVVLYCGTFHVINQDEVKQMLLALALLKRQGTPVHLLKTGHNVLPTILDPIVLDTFMTDLGFVPRAQLPELLAIADVLIQPGISDAFNDYRFPSKLPESLISGKPVILPRSNLGRFLVDGVEAMITENGRIDELITKITTLFENPELRRTIGRNGQAFAREHLQWGIAVEKILAFYREQCRPRACITSSPPISATYGVQVKLIAFYLPQFHAIPENDRWWVEGFTEWTNVVKAKPLFFNHYQPQLPANLNFYNLRDSEARIKQAELARQHGIYGFCYYYYWFNGKKLLEAPFEEVLKSGKPDFPFCLCWANENWTRRWDGKDQEILIKQEYSHEDDLNFIRHLIPAFCDKRYIRINGKPLLIIYRAELFPDIKRTVEIWRNEMMKEGIGEIYLAKVENFVAGVDPSIMGFDAAIEFSPSGESVGNTVNEMLKKGFYKEYEGIIPTSSPPYIYDYDMVVQNTLAKKPPRYKLFRCVFPSWDNTARRGGNATIFINSSPEKFHYYLKEMVSNVIKEFDGDERIVFINSWNKWGEGCHLEPDDKYGNAYLDAVNCTVQDMCDQIRTKDIELQKKNFKIQSHSNFITNSGEQIDRLEKDVKGMVTVIVVNYNGKKYLESCFYSLLNMDKDNISLEIIMVDNLSQDDSVSLVKEKFPEVIIVENDVNNFARALNLGIEHARGDYIAFLNNDTIVGKNWIEGLLDVIDGDERIGAVQSKILFSDGEIINSVGVEDVKDFYFKDIGFDERDHGQYQSAKEIDYFTGGSVLLRRACIEGVGNIDEDFIMFFEDIDYSIRCRKAGWKLFYSPESVVYHKYHGIVSSELTAFFCSRNRLLCLAKHFPLKLAGSVKTSKFYLGDQHENLYQSLIQAARKLIADHSAETSLKVLAEIKDVMIEIYGIEKTRYFFSQIEVLTGLKQIKMGIYDHLLKLTDADMLRASELVKEPSFYLSQISGPIYMAAMLDRPVLAVFNQVSEHDRKERHEQIAELNDKLAEAVKQVQSLTEWATSAETYAKSLAEASEADRAEAVKQMQSLTEWATSAETYAKSLAEASEADRAARLEVIHSLEEKINQIQSELAQEKKRADDLEQGWRELESAFTVRQARRVGLIKARKFARREFKMRISSNLWLGSS